MKTTYRVKTSNGEDCYMKLSAQGLSNVQSCRNVTSVKRATLLELFTRRVVRIAASVIAFSDWLGQQDETLVQCYEKRLKLWGVK